MRPLLPPLLRRQIRHLGNEDRRYGWGGPLIVTISAGIKSSKTVGTTD